LPLTPAVDLGPRINGNFQLPLTAGQLRTAAAIAAVPLTAPANGNPDAYM
jgi:hypothetical protein